MKTRYAIVLAVAIAFPAEAQMDQSAFTRRAESNKATCDVVAQSVSADSPTKVVAAMTEAKEKCIQELEIKQHLQTMEQCQKAAARKASAILPAPLHFKSCMNALGYEVAD